MPAPYPYRLTRGRFAALDRLPVRTPVHERLRSPQEEIEEDARIVYPCHVLPYCFAEQPPWITSATWDEFGVVENIYGATNLPPAITLDPPTGIWITTESAGSEQRYVYDGDLDEYVWVTQELHPRTVCVPSTLPDGYTFRPRTDIWGARHGGILPGTDGIAVDPHRPWSYEPSRGMAEAYSSSSGLAVTPGGGEFVFSAIDIAEGSIRPYFFGPPLLDTAPEFLVAFDLPATGSWFPPGRRSVQFSTGRMPYRDWGLLHAVYIRLGTYTDAGWSALDDFTMDVSVGYMDDFSDLVFTGALDNVLWSDTLTKANFIKPDAGPAYRFAALDGLDMSMRAVGEFRRWYLSIDYSATAPRPSLVRGVASIAYDTPLPFTVVNGHQRVPGGVATGSLPGY